MSSQDAIVEAARTLVAERGAAVPVAEIAAAAGVSRQAVYLHFGSRAGLLVAVVRAMDAEADIQARCRRALAAGDPVEALRGFLRTWLRFASEIEPVASALLAARRDDPDAAAAWEDRMAELRAGHAHAAARLAAAGRLRPGLSAAAAADLTWALTSVPVLAQLTAERGWAPRRAHAELADGAVRAVTGPAAS